MFRTLLMKEERKKKMRNYYRYYTITFLQLKDYNKTIIMKFQNTRAPESLQKKENHIYVIFNYQISQKKDNRALALHNSEEK